MPKLANYLHLPVQHGSDRVLARMKRGHTVLEYKQKIRKLREARPDISLSSDFIVGFPGETEADFQQTLDLFAESRFDQAFLFIFSARPGTAAAELEDQMVEPDVIQARFQRLVALHERLAGESNRRLLGRDLEVLSEGPSKKDPNVATTRSRGGKVVHVDGVIPAGTFLDVHVTEAAQHHVVGSPI